MHVAIDDTYASNVPSRSRHVTANRRTHVAVCFDDDEVDRVRRMLRLGLLFFNRVEPGLAAKEFHFAAIMNNRSLSEERRLHMVRFLANLYAKHHWRVFIQTIDDRTFRDHGLHIWGKLGNDLNLSKREDQSLLYLLDKIKTAYRANAVPMTLHLDEGRRKAGTSFGEVVFLDWPAEYHGRYESSITEPLLQIADFLAYSINRCTNLAIKAERTEFDYKFLNLIASMHIVCDDLKRVALPRAFGVEAFDQLHDEDRAEKGLPRKPRGRP